MSVMDTLVSRRTYRRFEQRPVELVIVAYGLSRGLHLRRQVSVQSPYLVERKYRNLDVPSLLFFRIQVEQPLLLEALSQYDLRSDVGKAVACGLGQERNSSGRPRVHLYDEDVFVLVYYELYVVQAYYSYAQSQLLGVTQYGALDLV